MLEKLQALLGATGGPSHMNVGEAFTVHQTLTAYYYLQSKCALFEHHSQAPELKAWWAGARQAIADRITQLEPLLDRFGVPRPPSFPVTTELTDQLIAADGLAMVQGMMMADVIGIQASLHPEISLMFKDMFNSTMTFGAALVAIVDRQGWTVSPPTYQSAAPQ